MVFLYLTHNSFSWQFLVNITLRHRFFRNHSLNSMKSFIRCFSSTFSSNRNSFRPIGPERIFFFYLVVKFCRHIFSASLPSKNSSVLNFFLHKKFKVYLIRYLAQLRSGNLFGFASSLGMCLSSDSFLDVSFIIFFTR